MSRFGLIDVSEANYHADLLYDQPTLSRSIAHILCTQSPRHARQAHPRLSPNYQPKEEQKFDIGTACHDLLLFGMSRVEIVDADSWRTADAKAARAEARANGRLPLLAKHEADVREMVNAVHEQLLSIDADPPLFRDGKAEQTLTWEENGAVCRARPDWIRDDLGAIDDFKTTSASANPERWIRTMFQTGCDIQPAFYLRGVEAVFADRYYEAVPKFRFVVAETYPPYALSVIEPGPDVLALGFAKMTYALRVWRESLASGDWPAYPPRVATAELPGWEEARWMEKTAREEAAA